MKCCQVSIAGRLFRRRRVFQGLGLVLALMSILLVSLSIAVEQDDAATVKPGRHAEEVGGDAPRSLGRPASDKPEGTLDAAQRTQQFVDFAQREAKRLREAGGTFDIAEFTRLKNEKAIELTEDLETGTLSLEQLSQLRLLLQLTPGRRPELEEHLLQRAKDESADGALAAILYFEIAMNQYIRSVAPSQGVKRLGHVLHHPGLAAAVEEGRTDRFFNLFGFLGPDNLRGQEADVVQLSRFVTGDLEPVELAERATIANGLVLLAGHGQIEDLKAYEPIRRRLATLYTDAAANSKASGGSERLVGYLQRVADGLGSRLGRGLFIGQFAPELDFEWVSEGKGYRSLKDLRGKVVMIDFWATWCGGCIAAFPQVAKVQERYAGSPVEIIALTSLQGSQVVDGKKIDTTDDPNREYEMTYAFAKQREVEWAVAFSKQNVVNPEYGIRSIPHVALIDAEGKLRYSGGFSQSKAIELIDELLKEAGQTVPSG